MRIAIGGLLHESATFSRVPTELDDFRIVAGAALLDPRGGAADEVAGIVDRLGGRPDVELLPLALASATPSGLVAPAAYGEIRSRLLRHLAAAGPLDGVILVLHGSTTVRSLEDAQGDLVGAVRALVGRAVPIVATLDLHATPSDRVTAAVDALVAYRTAPHRDARETGALAAALVERMVARGERPAIATARVPLLLPGELGQTEREPMASLMRRARAAEAGRPEIWSVSVLQGYPWADLPAPFASVVVVADAGPRGEAAARQTAADLQRRLWAMREGLYRSVEVQAVAAALAEAGTVARQGGLVYLCDSGDNPTAGADGDDARLLPTLLASGLARVTFGAVADRAAALRARDAGLGAALRLAVGGAPSARPEASVLVEGRVAALAAHPEGGMLARIATANTDLVVSERRMGMRQPAVLTALGIDPAAPGSVHVLKSGYLFPAFADLVAAAPGGRAILLATPGASTLDLGRLPYRRLARPAYPLDAGDQALEAPLCRPSLGAP